MSTPFYDLASLVVVPSGYKASKVYAQKPLTTDGQLAFSRASTATRVNSAGLIETVSSNVPRLDYLNSSCPRLILEGQRTNLLQFSEQIDNAYWTKQGASITANTAVSPDGYTNADSLIENSATANHLAMRTGITITNATAYTASVYFKANTRTRAAIQLAGAGFFDTANGLVIFNLSTGTIVSQSGNATGTITAMGNGWYRCTATKTSVGTDGVVAFNLVDSSNNISYTGNGTSGVFIWGAQLEAGAYATSYIPTLGAAVTRLADACSKTGISSLIGQTEGTLFLDVVAQVDTAESQDFGISDGTANNRASIRLNNSGLINAIGVFGGSVQFSMGTGAYVTGQRYKIALAYKLNDVVLYVNGVQSATDTSATISGTLSRLGFDVNTTGTQNLKSRVNQALLFKTRLTNAQLAELTTL